MPNIVAVLGDITKQDVDAVVNAAHPSLRGTAGGVDRAIHREGGPAVLAECVARYPHGLKPGEAGATTAGALPARWIIHAVGPKYTGERDRPLLESCYQNALRVAASLGSQNVAFPLIGAGHNGWTRTSAIAVALDSIAATDTPVEEVSIVTPDPSLSREIQAELCARRPTPVEPDTVGALFEREPVRYGLRGDPYLWRELRARFADMPLPPEWDELEELLHTAIEHSLNEHNSISGKPDFTQTVYVADFDPGHGLSAGSVCLPWWAGTAIPILLDRHAGGTDHSEPLNRPANAGMLWMTLSELRKRTNHLPGALPVVSRHDYHCVPVQAVAVVDGQLVLLPYSVGIVEIELDRIEVRDDPLSYGLVQVGDEATTRRVTLRGPVPAVRSYLIEVLGQGDHEAAERWLSRIRAV